MKNTRIHPRIMIAVLVLAAAGILAAISSPFAYEACRQVMLNEDGYGVWKLESSYFLYFRAQYNFFDGFNTTTCEARGFGTDWIGTKRLETLAACMLSLDDTGGNECPRANYGVSP